MANPTDYTGTRRDHLAYAPKWARDPEAPDRDRLQSPSIAQSEFAQHHEQLFPNEELVNQPRSDRSLNSLLNEVHIARTARSRSAESVLSKGREQPLSERDLLRRSLEPEIIRDTWPIRRREWRPATLVALAVVMAVIGVAILLFFTDNLPRQWNRTPGFSNELMARFQAVR
jgi:hypothetical protein